MTRYLRVPMGIIYDKTYILYPWVLSNILSYIIPMGTLKCLVIYYTHGYSQMSCHILCPWVLSNILSYRQLSSHPVFSGVRVTRSLVLYICFVDRYLSFCSFSFGHCVVCPSLIYEFWLPLWYLQTLPRYYG
jgi:hypothetical protein